MRATATWLRRASGLLVAGWAAVAGAAAADDRLLLEERYSEAFEQAVERLSAGLAARGALHPDTVGDLERVGVIAHAGGDQRTAEEVLDAALAVRRALPRDEAALVRTLVARGRAARYRDRRAVAKASFDEAARIVNRMKAAPPALRADVLQEQGDWSRAGGLDPAIRLYRLALIERRLASPRPDLALADTLTWLAWMLDRDGQAEEAAALAREARGVLDALGLRRHTLRGTLAEILAGQEVVAGRLGSATALWEEEAEIGEAARAKQLGGFSRRRFPLDGFDALAFSALRSGRPEDAWTLMQRGRAASHVDFATLALWESRAPASWELSKRTRRSLRELERRLAAAGGSSPRWSERTAPLFVRTLHLRAALSEMERRYLLANRRQAPSQTAVAAALGPRTALVGWLEFRVGENGTATVPVRSSCFAYVLRQDRPIVWVPLWETRSSEEYATLVAGYGRVFGSLQRAASWRRRVEPDPRVRQELRAWGALHVQPLLPHLGGIEHVVLDTPLQPVELAGLADGRALGDVFDVSYVPSALVLELLAERAPARASRSGEVLAVSGPAEPTAQTIASLVDLKETERSHRQLRSAYRRDGTPLEALPPLRYSALEARAVAARFDRSTVLVDQRSGERSLDLLARSRGLRTFGVVHVAAHTLTDAAPEACALALADRTRTGGSPDGLLEVGDILLEWELDAELLTLSGCETFRAAGAGRGEPYGFVSALFGSGARRILSSVWTVDDRATAILMDRFYENLTGQYQGGRMGYHASPMPPARALREAKRHVSTLRDASGRRPFEHPAYWGGFVLAGLP